MTREEIDKTIRDRCDIVKQHGIQACLDTTPEEYRCSAIDYCGLHRMMFELEWHRVTGEEQGDTYNILAIGSDNDGCITSLTEMNRVNAYMRTSAEFQETDLFVWYKILDFPQ